MTRRAYAPRAYFNSAARFLDATPRCNLFAKPGMGKSSIVLSHLDLLHNVWGEDRPTLILGPLRVAQSVWTEEAAKWEHLERLRLISCTGTPGDRDAALDATLAGKSQVMAVNYENLPWLTLALSKRRAGWPFATVVADESTKLKSFRLRQGSVRAQTLAPVAHRHVERWINLTGTPSPNGLKDLWGQCWFVDAGQRLGRSFSAFEDRFYRWRRAQGKGNQGPGKQGLIQEMVEGSDDVIYDLIADVSLSLDPKDWFDMREPVVTAVMVDLPKAARDIYRRMEREMFTELASGEAIEAVSAAAKTVKCLQLANGAAYTDQSGKWEAVHDAKLDALDDLQAELGEPLLVAYHFKSDLARLKARFPHALDLSIDADMRRAKAGHGRLWLGHPGGMGHGVDGLQNHCRSIAFFGHWWDLEQYDQIIERIGPMRQLQAGNAEPVFVYHLLARGTLDQLVAARRDSKRAVQDLLMEYMKGRT